MEGRILKQVCILQTMLEPRGLWTVMPYITQTLIFGPAIIMFFASLLPAIAFGEQLERDTVHTLSSTTICGIIHSIMGGQRLLILGVAEPIALMYMYLYEFATKRTSIGEAHFIAWAGWVCVWTGFMLIILGIFSACDLVNRFTHVAGELFSFIVAILFLQQAIKGAVYEFKVPHHENPTKIEYQFHWRFANGLFGIIPALGILFSSLKLVSTRSWAFGTGFMRSLMADFGIPLMFLIWTEISYSAYGIAQSSDTLYLCRSNPCCDDDMLVLV